MGTCVHCKREWYSVCSGKLVQAKWIPTCPEGEIGVICTDCFDVLPGAEITTLVQREQNASYQQNEAELLDRPGVEIIRMTPMEYRLVDCAISGWVKYLKGEASEPPFEQETLAL